MNIASRFLTFLAKMGLTVRDDPKKAVDVAGRKWGEAVDGFRLSLLLRSKEDPDELPAVSVAIQNLNPEARSLATHGWLSFFQLSVIGPDGVEAALTPYGDLAMKREREATHAPVSLLSGQATEADIPLGSIYTLKKGKYRIQASCQPTGNGRITSNSIEIAS